MDRPLVNRVLLGLATALFVSGCAMGVVGLHPAVQKPALSRLGMIVTIASLPPWMVHLVACPAQHQRAPGR